MNESVAFLILITGIAAYLTAFRTMVWLRARSDRLDGVTAGFSAIAFAVAAFHLGRYLSTDPAMVRVFVRSEVNAIFAATLAGVGAFEVMRNGPIRWRLVGASVAFVGLVTALIWTTDWVVTSGCGSAPAAGFFGGAPGCPRGWADIPLTVGAVILLVAAWRGEPEQIWRDAPERRTAVLVVIGIAGVTMTSDALLYLGLTSVELFPYAFVACSVVLDYTLVRQHARLLRETDALVGMRTRELEAERSALARVADEAERARSRAEASERRAQESVQQLRQADRLASIGTLAAGTAHEINNPLTFIGGNLEFLRMQLDRGPLTERARAGLREAMGDAKAGVDRIAQIVRDLRDFAEPTGSERGPVALHDVAEAATRLAGHALQHCATLVCDYGEAPLVAAHARRLTQVVVNLLLNAVQAVQAVPAADTAGAAAPKITIRIRSQEGRGILEVLDDGPGIPTELVDRIFDPFVTTKPVGQGTGLGLAVCHGIVRGLGGVIRAENRPEGGAVIRIELPAHERSAPGAHPQPQEAPDEDDDAIAARRVLVIDDEPTVGKIVRRLLPTCEVRAVESGDEALAAWTQGPWDLVLCDLMLPNESGADIYGRLIAADPEAASRFVVITGGAFSPPGQAFLEAFDGLVITKPFLREELDAALAYVGATSAIDPAAVSTGSAPSSDSGADPGSDSGGSDSDPGSDSGSDSGGSKPEAAAIPS